tara:strand:- start:167 stop:808 length:642 start_codon:yes stop_codon:yes gene_type:complete
MNIENYSLLGIQNITKQPELLDKTDLNEISGLRNELQNTYRKKQLWRSEVEILISVLNDVRFPTNSSKYWQSCREQGMFFHELINTSCRYEKALGELELLEIELNEIDNATRKGRAQARIKNAEIIEKRFAIIDLKIQAKDRVREIKIWHNVKAKLISDDPSIDTESYETHQLESYKQRFRKELEIATRSHNPSVFKSCVSSLETIERVENEN